MGVRRCYHEGKRRFAALKTPNRSTFATLVQFVVFLRVRDLGKLLDIEMLVSPVGKERTAAKYKERFARAGLRLTRIVQTQSPHSVIEAVMV
jgi:hypothetical protein